MFDTLKYEKEFKEEAVKLCDEVAVKQAAVQLEKCITRWQSGGRSGKHTATCCKA